MAEEPVRSTESKFLLVTLVAVAFVAFLVVREFLLYILFGVILAFSFHPVYRRLLKATRHRATAGALALLFTVGVVLGPLVAGAYLLYRDTRDLISQIDPSDPARAIEGLVERVGADSAAGRLAGFLASRVGDLVSIVGADLLEIIPGVTIGLVITGFVIYYGFVDGGTFYQRVRLALPLPDAVEDVLFSRLREVTRAVFLGSIYISLLGAVLGTITFFVFDVPNAIFWGFIMFILGVLPVVGAPLVWIPWGLWKFFDGHPIQAAGIIGINVIVGVAYIDHILRPKIVGRMGSVHPVIVLVGALGGIEIFGFLGFAIGPLVLAVLVAIIESYIETHPRWVERSRLGLELYRRPDAARAAEAARRAENA